MQQVACRTRHLLVSTWPALLSPGRTRSPAHRGFRHTLAFVCAATASSALTHGTVMFLYYPLPSQHVATEFVITFVRAAVLTLAATFCYGCGLIGQSALL